MTTGSEDVEKTTEDEGVVKTVVYALLIALTVRTFLFEPFNIPSSSMKPTLLIGDYLFVSKYSYGVSKYSFPFGAKIFGDNFEGRILGSEPERGDVIVFRKPTDTNIDYIKRLIGLPGDTVQVKQGQLYINNTVVPRKIVKIGDGRNGIPLNTKEYEETLPNGVKHSIWERSDSEYLDNFGPYLVPKGYYFFMGDNRDNSSDSRVLNQVGPVPFENFIGRADVLFFSHRGDDGGEDYGDWWEVWKWPSMIRFGRIFNAID
ncbi:signal peptidase I [Kiloniella majae]|uniref:signal peptidase I n=1 Tax=Kiloniella majae TaxID=1938558 RepID=UPI000A277BF1|nr:signal peptidase I [Kiloniella majae]